MLKASQLKKIDWPLLLFLFCFTNQAYFTLKLAALILIYLFRPNFRLGLFKGRLPIFYPLIVLLSVVNLLVNVRDFSIPYLSAFAVGNAMWLFCLLGYHQIKLSIDKTGTGTIHRTLKIFTLLNFVGCGIQFVQAAYATHHINPFFNDLPFPYGLSTGDFMAGLFLKNAYCNMMVSAMLAIYFLFRRNYLYSIVAMFCEVLTFINAATILIFLLLLLMFVGVLLGNMSKAKTNILRLVTPRGSLYAIPILLLLVPIEYLIIAPANFSYSVAQVQTIGQKHAASYIDSKVTNDTSLFHKQAVTKQYLHVFAGKKLSFLETFHFLKSTPENLLLGAGTGRFSSAIAQRMAGYDSSRFFSRFLPRYQSPLYAANHLLLLQERMQLPPQYYSNANWPDSEYNHILGDYGAIGFLLLLIFYIGYFLRRYKSLTYGWWLLILLVPFAWFSFLFEGLCVMVFFELLMEIDVKEDVNDYKFEAYA